MAYINLEIAENDTEELLIPTTGNRAYVFLQADPANGEAITIYIKVGSDYEILKKLSAGQNLDYSSSLFNDKDFFEGKEVWVSGQQGDVIFGRYY